jgi:hypothetical protein
MALEFEKVMETSGLRARGDSVPRRSYRG